MNSQLETKNTQNKEGVEYISKISTARQTKIEYKIPQAGEVIGKYVLNEKIGQGSFGIVFEGHEIDSIKKVAIKIEISSEQKYSQLENEYEIYSKLEGVAGFPRIRYFGRSSSYNYLVMEYLGISLEDMLAIRNRMLSAKTIFIIGKRMVSLIKSLHEIGYVHRDVKPDNFLIGKDPRKIFLIDLGMAKEYIRNGQHIPKGTGKKLTGTPRYASVNAHEGNELGRKDDLESIGYIVLYLAKGKLPWQGLKESKREKCRMIGEMKKEMRIEEVSKGLPGGIEIAEYFKYVNSLNFDSTPDYAYLIDIFDSALMSHGLTDDGVFEWEHVFRGYTEHGSEDSLEGHKIKKKTLWKRIRKIFCCI